jgi:hypothetical protein
MSVPTRVDPWGTFRQNVAMINEAGNEMLDDMYLRARRRNGPETAGGDTVLDDRRLDHNQQSGRRGRGEGANG